MAISTEAPRTNWPRVALGLVVATMAYNVIEAVVALWSGTAAKSIALIGFGLDSVIETSAATLLLWRLLVEARGADPVTVERTEHRVHRFVGVTFLLLATYVMAEAVWTLWGRAAPERSVVGIMLAAASLIIMPLVAWAKLRAAREIGSAALRAEAKETLACSYLSFTLLIGLVANGALGWWWAANRHLRTLAHRKRCVMEARIEGRQPIAVTEHANTLLEAVNGAAERMTHLIDSVLGRAMRSERSRDSFGPESS